MGFMLINVALVIFPCALLSRMCFIYEQQTTRGEEVEFDGGRAACRTAGTGVHRSPLCGELQASED